MASRNVIVTTYLILLSAMTACMGDTTSDQDAVSNQDPETAQAESAICAHQPAAGLGLYFFNGSWNPDLSPNPDPERPTALHVVDGHPRYLQELYIKSSVPTTPEAGLTPVTTSGDLAGLDWNGVSMDSEDWRLQSDGAFWQHQRFFRNANWMEPSGEVKLIFRNAAGDEIDEAELRTGRDDRRRLSDDFFVRRFVARTISLNCAAENDCSNPEAVHLAEAFVQLRVALQPEDTFAVPSAAATLDVVLTKAPGKVWSVPVVHDPAPTDGTGYGFGINLSLVDPPSRGYYLPGEVVEVQMDYVDGNGQPLFPGGALPSYAEAVHWRDAAKGLRYLTFDGIPMLYWAHKATQGAMQTFLAGPVDQMLAVGATPITPGSLFLNEIPAATATFDGWTSLIQETPRTPTMFSCLLGFFPPACDFPTPNTFTYTVPADAKPGTWQAGVKARRYWEGEPSMRAAFISLQVGSPTPTTFPGHDVPDLGDCTDCHAGRTSIQKTGHGFPVSGVSPACMACHTDGYYFEPDAGIDIRMQYLHGQSRRLDPPH